MAERTIRVIMQLAEPEADFKSRLSGWLKGLAVCHPLKQFVV